MTTDKFQEDCERYIMINEDGEVEYDSRLVKLHPHIRCVCFDNLWSIIGDNADDTMGIDWVNVWKEYEK